MRQRPLPRLQALDAQYLGLRNQVETMFEEFCSSEEIKRTIETQHGVRIGLRSIDRYKQEYWRARREPAQPVSGPTGSRHSQAPHDPRQCRDSDSSSSGPRLPKDRRSETIATTVRCHSVLKSFVMPLPGVTS
jgi:hypothetical protein